MLSWLLSALAALLLAALVSVKGTPAVADVSVTTPLAAVALTKSRTLTLALMAEASFEAISVRPLPPLRSAAITV